MPRGRRKRKTENWISVWKLNGLTEQQACSLERKKKKEFKQQWIVDRQAEAALEPLNLSSFTSRG